MKGAMPGHDGRELVLKGSNGSQVTAKRRDRVLIRFNGRA